VDEDYHPGRFLLTGSANVLTLPRVADSLAGRIETIQMLPPRPQARDGFCFPAFSMRGRGNRKSAVERSLN